MTTRLKRFDMIMGFRLLTLLFSFILFSIYATPLNLANHAFYNRKFVDCKCDNNTLTKGKVRCIKSTILWSV